MTHRLSLAQRAFMLGYRRARAKARREREQLADRFFEVIDEIHAEMAGIKDDVLRRRAVDTAIEDERDPTTWLN